MQMTAGQVSQMVREKLESNEGRVMTIPILGFPDGTFHCEPGESNLAKRAAQFMLASMSNDPNCQETFDYHAKRGIMAARAFFKALREDAAAEKVKVDAERLAEREKIGKGVVLVPGENDS
jgi:hypothetical protein